MTATEKAKTTSRYSPREAPASKLMRWVTEISTGRRGWVVQELNYGFHLRVRWEGERGIRAVSQVRVE